MNCPKGHDAKQVVIESRQHEGAVFRKRICQMCGKGYHTKEEIYEGPIIRERPDKKPQARPVKPIHQWAGW